MPAEPSQVSSGGAARGLEIYRKTVQQASADGSVLLGKIIALARQTLQTQEAASRDLGDRQAIAESAQMLRKHEPALCSAYPGALLGAFSRQDNAKQASATSVSEVQFDQLELMDETQVLSTVAIARVLQVVRLAAETSLADLDRLICSVLGMDRVRVEANVLRPESYVRALQEVVEETRVPAAMRAQWFNAMAAALGHELRLLYTALCAQLRKEGVVSVAYAVPNVRSGGRRAATVPGGAVDGGQKPAAGIGAQPGGSGPSAQGVGSDSALLTLDKLRKLLAGESISSQPAGRVEQFAEQFSRQFEDDDLAAANSPNNGFESTVPAALEALTEMKQVERVVQSLEQRREINGNQPQPQAHTLEGQRLALRRSAKDLAQALSLEVVTLMVDNMAHDPHLLEPVREVIRNLEPALLRLALVDMRFFSDKHHPARHLLQEVSQRSMAFDSIHAPGFETFYKGLQDTLGPLFLAPIESAEVFECKLADLQQEWKQDAHTTERDHLAAVEVLSHAEARNLLAEKIARGIEGHSAAAQVPAIVMDFLCGPWSQVVAQARIKQGAGSAAAEKFEGLIPAMLWSAHPELARANPAKLTRLVPRLVISLREGLQTIQYPDARTDAFLESLMTIHQQAFRPASTAPVTEPEASSQRSRLPDDGDPWIAPQEAQASNFVGLTEISLASEPAFEPLLPEMNIVPEQAALADVDMPLGSWVELKVNEEWVRIQLTWASPHGTLYLFTGAYGNTQSMSRRLRDKLLSSGKMRLLVGQAFVEGALDAVAQTAIRNSVGSVE
ncbi:DUF1631 family protein [Rhodoferax sp. GW822-FHT02A01]|uniref:DUF1631 family protein n=1 Tax=Rhodoferax sp. GW822-FHT02A01 TaxID=3141537 RepID=UPI00315CEC29